MKFLHGCIHVHVYALHLPEYPVNHKSCTQNAKGQRTSKKQKQSIINKICFLKKIVFINIYLYHMYLLFNPQHRYKHIIFADNESTALFIIKLNFLS